MTLGSVELQRLCLPTSTTRKVRLLLFIVGICVGNPSLHLGCLCSENDAGILEWVKVGILSI